MRVNQPRQQRVFAQVKNLAWAMLLDICERADIDDSIFRNRDGAVFNWRAVHCHNKAGPNDHLVL